MEKKSYFTSMDIFFDAIVILASIMNIFLASYSLVFVFYEVLLTSIIFCLIKGKFQSFSMRFNIFRIYLIFSALIVMYNISKTCISKINDINEALIIPVLILLLIISFAVVILLSALLFRNNKVKTKKAESFLSNIMKKKSEDEDKRGLMICRDFETDEDVYIPYKDRFLHSLILGPTGGGKTSMGMIPQLLQDVQDDNCGLAVFDPKGDLSKTVYAMGIKFQKEIIYFNPTSHDCPTFNPLEGEESIVIENMVTIFTILSDDSASYYKTIMDSVIRNAVKVIKRIEKAYKDSKTGISKKPATLIKISQLISNLNNEGKIIIKEFMQLPVSLEEKKENLDIASWFNNIYFNGKSKEYMNSSGIRAELIKLTSNVHLRRILNPENGIGDFNFEDIINNNKKIVLSGEQGELRDLSSYLNYFLILSLESAVFKRKGTEWTRTPFYLYIDECQRFFNAAMSDLLTQGRSYRVATTLATQSRSGMDDGSKTARKLLSVISTNCRNIILFAGLESDDAKYYSAAFGEKEVIEERQGETRQKFDITYGFKEMNYPSESIQRTKKTVPIWSPHQIRYLEPKEIIYSIIVNNKVEIAKKGKVEYIDENLNEELKDICNKITEKEEKLRRQKDENIQVIDNDDYDDFD